MTGKFQVRVMEVTWQNGADAPIVRVQLLPGQAERVPWGRRVTTGKPEIAYGPQGPEKVVTSGGCE